MTTAYINEIQQAQITRATVLAAKLMLQHGAESRLIAQTATRLGKALGADEVELAISSSAITLTTLCNDRCITTVRRLRDHGINMQMVCDVQRITIMAEKRLLDARQAEARLKRLQPHRYNRWLVVVMVGLSCGCFSRFFGGDATIVAITSVAAAVAMFVRQELAARHHHPLLTFSITAFVATCVASVSAIYSLGNLPEAALAGCVLLVVPGFPLINAVSDLVKGHANMGMARLLTASMLMLSACVGIVAAVAVMGIKGGL